MFIRKSVRVIKPIVFGVIVLWLLALLSDLSSPQFVVDAGNSIGGLYEQPRDSVQVAILGASGLNRAISPNVLHEEYGLRAHNCGSSNQSTLVSYYLLEEVLRLHENSLSVVVLDAAPLVHDKGESDWGHNAVKVYSNMEPSLVRFKLLRAMTTEYKTIDFVENLIPLFQYHSRWSNPNDNLVPEAHKSGYYAFMHGQTVDWKTFVSNASRGRCGKYTRKNNDLITDQIDEESSIYESSRDAGNMRYFERIVSRCREKGIALLLVKTPSQPWNNNEHDNVQLISEQYGVPFLDMCEASVWDTCDLSYDFDYYDERHVNLGGSIKISRFLGEYLAKVVGVFDFEKTEGDLSADWKSFVQLKDAFRLQACTRLEEYLELLDTNRYTVFVATDGGPAEELSLVVKDGLESLGFAALSEIKPDCPYVAIRDGDRVIAEVVKPAKSIAKITGKFKAGKLVLLERKMQPGASLGNPFVLNSDTRSASHMVSIKIDGSEESAGGDGVNFVVFDKSTGLLVDSSSFDIEEKAFRSDSFGRASLALE